MVVEARRFVRRNKVRVPGRARRASVVPLRRLGERRGHDVGQRPLRTLAVMLVAVNQHRRQRPMPGEVPDLIQADIRLLALFDRRGDAGMA